MLVKSIRSAWYRSLMPFEYVFRRGNFRLNGLCIVCASCPAKNRLILPYDSPVYRFNDCTPPKLPDALGVTNAVSSSLLLLICRPFCAVSFLPSLGWCRSVDNCWLRRRRVRNFAVRVVIIVVGIVIVASWLCGLWYQSTTASEWLLRLGAGRVSYIQQSM